MAHQRYHLGLSTPHQPTTQPLATPAGANATNEPTSSESVSSSPSRLSSDAADVRTTTPHMNMNRRLSSSTYTHSLHSVPESAAALSSPRRSPSLSLPRAHDMDHHYHHPHQPHHQGRSRSTTTLQRVATGFRRLTHTSGVPAVSEEDWSVFGEAMAHEGVQPQPQPQPQPSAPSPTDIVPTLQQQEVLASSPVSDDHLEDFIPFAEGGGAREVREGERDGDDDDEEGRSSLGTGLLASSHSHSHARSSSDTESTSLASPKDTDQQDQHLRGGKGRSSWWERLLYLPTLPTLYRNILKCSIAYFLGSLFTYYAPLSRFISEMTQDGLGEKYPSAMGHMVATV